MKKVIYTQKAPEPIGPYSQAILANDTLYVSGQIAYEASLENDISKETEKVLETIKVIIEAADMSMDQIVKCSIFLKSMADFPLVNEVYGQYFKVNPPARETVQVAMLPKNVNVEISAIAIK